MYTFSIASGTLVLFVLTADAHALPVTPDPAPLVITAGDPNAPLYRRLPNIAFDGIGILVVEHDNLVVNCTGSLLGSGRHVLTAAHCVSADGGAITAVSGNITFQSSLGGEDTIAISQFARHPSWTGDLRAGGDIAVLTLQRQASAAILRYDPYSGTGEVGRVAELVGVGASGTGATGYTIQDGLRRGGLNRLDGTFVGTLDRFEGWTAGANAFLIDFDDGSAAHDALSVLGLADRGTGISEVFPFSGDSGGPAFLDGSIAAISSFHTRVFRGDGTTPDIDNLRNGSFGEVSGLTRVSQYSEWIETRISAVPEPDTLLLITSAAGTLLIRKYRNAVPSRVNYRGTFCSSPVGVRCVALLTSLRISLALARTASLASFSAASARGLAAAGSPARESKAIHLICSEPSARARSARTSDGIDIPDVTAFDNSRSRTLVSFSE